MHMEKTQSQESFEIKFATNLIENIQRLHSASTTVSAIIYDARHELNEI